MAEKYGLLIDYTWCTGCHSCEMACKVEHGWQAGEANGIQLFEDGPRLMPNGKYEYNYLPVMTSLCDLCADRTAMGKLPTCVHHCQSACMKYGTVDVVAETHMQLPRPWIYVPELYAASSVVGPRLTAGAPAPRGRHVRRKLCVTDRPIPLPL